MSCEQKNEDVGQTRKNGEEEVVVPPAAISRRCETQSCQFSHIEQSRQFSHSLVEQPRQFCHVWLSSPVNLAMFG